MGPLLTLRFLLSVFAGAFFLFTALLNNSLAPCFKFRFNACLGLLPSNISPANCAPDLIACFPMDFATGFNMGRTNQPNFATILPNP